MLFFLYVCNSMFFSVSTPTFPRMMWNTVPLTISNPPAGIVGVVSVTFAGDDEERGRKTAAAASPKYLAKAKLTHSV